MAEIETVEIRPQAGKQEMFLSTPADIAIYGGSAGGGKSFGLLLEPLRHVTSNSEFYAVAFRRSTTQIRNPGGLWDESMKLYPFASGTPIQTILEWKWNKGGRVKFAHLEHEKTVLDWQGSQIPLLLFDELTHFSATQFFYMLSRNRSMCGVKPYVRATCNPDADSWVAEFIDWWIDSNGFAIEERAGKLRWFVRVKGVIMWTDTREECIELHGIKELPADHPNQAQPKSVTFIPAKLQDNPLLMDADPGYMSNLLALDIVTQARLLGGNWKIKWDSGQEVFREQSFLVNGAGVAYPNRCDGVYAVIDSAMKDGSGNDGTAVVYFAIIRYPTPKLIVLDWDVVLINSDLLTTWLPNVLRRCEDLAKECQAGMGSLGAFIEDKSSGITLNQYGKRMAWPVTPIKGEITAVGKDGRAIAASGPCHRGDVKFSSQAYEKVVNFKDKTKNHLMTQTCSYRIGDKDAAKRADDLSDCLCYGVIIGLNGKDGF